MSEPIQFIGALAGTNSSTRFLSASLDGDMKIIFETDASQAGAVLRLLTMGGKRLKITVEEMK